MEALPFSEFIPKWQFGTVDEDADLEEIPVEESQKGLLAKVMATFGFMNRKKPS